MIRVRDFWCMRDIELLCLDWTCNNIYLVHDTPGWWQGLEHERRYGRMAQQLRFLDWHKLVAFVLRHRNLDIVNAPGLKFWGRVKLKSAEGANYVYLSYSSELNCSGFDLERLMMAQTASAGFLSYCLVRFNV